jgi:hypothetical protein
VQGFEFQPQYKKTKKGVIYTWEVKVVGRSGFNANPGKVSRRFYLKNKNKKGGCALSLISSALKKKEFCIYNFSEVVVCIYIYVIFL